MLEKIQEMIKGSKTNSEIHAAATPSLQEASTGSTPNMDSNGKKSENLPNGRSGNFKQLSAVDFQFRRDKGLCFRCDERFHSNHVFQSEKVEHNDAIRAIPEGECIEESGTMIDEKPSGEVEAVGPVIVNEDDPISNVIAFSRPHEQIENEEVSIKAECNETKSAEVELVEYVAIEDDDRAPQAKEFEVSVEHFLGFDGGSVVFGSVLQWIVLDSYQSAAFVGYLEEAWNFIRTMLSSLGYPLMQSSYPYSLVEDNVFFKWGSNVRTQGAK